MKNLIATVLLFSTGASLVSCGPIETSSTHTSTPKSTASTTSRNTHGTGTGSLSTKLTSSTRNSTISSEQSTHSSHLTNSSSLKSTSSGHSTLKKNPTSSTEKTTTSTSREKSSSHSKVSSSHSSSSSSSSSSSHKFSGRSTISANATTQKSTGTFSASSSSLSFSGRSTISANATTPKFTGSVSASSSSLSFSGRSTISANATTPKFTGSVSASSSSLSFSGRSTISANATTQKLTGSVSASSSSLSFSGRITISANATQKSTGSNYRLLSTASSFSSISGRPTKSANATERTATFSGRNTTTSSTRSSSSHASSSTAKASQAQSSTHHNVGSPTSSAFSPLRTFSGPQDGTVAPWNLNNASCYEMPFLSGPQQWAAVNGDSVVETFNEMYAGNKLMCSDCFGMTKGACTSQDPTCERGLGDLAALANGTNHNRWDTAAAIFAQDPDDTDLMCDIGTGECSSSPKCELLDGPGAWAILKSIETMHDMLQNVYDSIQAAGAAAGHQMQAFSNTFAPVPSFKNDAIWLMVMIAIIGAVVGIASGGLGIAIAAEGATLVPLLVSTAVGGAFGAGSGVAINTFFFGLPAPGDTDSPLGTIISATLLTWSNFCDNLMAQGSYVFAGNNGGPSTTISMQNLMKGGALMQANANASQGFVAMQPVMEVIMFQQLALYTWQNLQSEDVQSTPFIVYDNTPCDKIHVTWQQNCHGGYYGGSCDPDTPVFDSDSILSYLPGAYTLDANITYNGKCYWLLDGKPTGQRVFGKKVAPSFFCHGDNALPGATNTDLKKNAGIFAGLSLEHWIIPSVLGWEQNHNQNDYQMASQLGQLVSDPLQPATVNIPICEYIRNKDNPGIGCPKINQHQTDACDTYPKSSGVDQPGAYNAGRCNAHIDQYQRNEGRTVNPLDVFQLSISIYDDWGIQIGQATKQSAANALSVVDSVLPFDLIVVTGAGDNDPDKLWYSDQYWNSTSCSVGAYDSGMRQMDCGFNCPLPSGSPPVSATIAHPIPGAVSAAAGGDKTFLNTWIPSSATPTPTGPPPPPPKPNYATGSCGIHVVQYQKNEGNENPTSNFLLDVTIFDGKQKPIGQLSQVSALAGVPVNIPGLVSAFTITAGKFDNDALVCNFQGKTFSLDAATCGKYAIGAYDSGNRNMDCGFPC